MNTLRVQVVKTDRGDLMCIRCGMFGGDRWLAIVAPGQDQSEAAAGIHRKCLPFMKAKRGPGKPRCICAPGGGAYDMLPDCPVHGVEPAPQWGVWISGGCDRDGEDGWLDQGLQAPGTRGNAPWLGSKEEAEAKAAKFAAMPHRARWTHEAKPFNVSARAAERADRDIAPKVGP